MKLLILALISFSAMAASPFKDGSYGVKEVKLNHPGVSGLCKYEVDSAEEEILFDDGETSDAYSIGVFPQRTKSDCELKLLTTKQVDVVLLTTVQRSSLKLEVAAGRFITVEDAPEYSKLRSIGFIPFGATSIFGSETYYLLRPEVKFAEKNSVSFTGDCKALKKQSFFADTLVKCELKDQMGYVLLKRD